MWPLEKTSPANVLASLSVSSMREKLSTTTPYGFVIAIVGVSKKFHIWAMANGYQEGLTLERTKNDEGYSPGNCEWATMSQQSQNTSKVRFLTLNGETHSMREWSDVTGLKKETIRGRLRKGWSVKKALTMEVMR